MSVKVIDSFRRIVAQKGVDTPNRNQRFAATVEDHGKESVLAVEKASL